MLQTNDPKSDLIQPGKFMHETAVLRKRVITNKLERCTLHQILATDTTAQHAILWISSRPSRFPSHSLTNEFWTNFVDKKIPSLAARPIIIESSWHVHECISPDYVKEGQQTIAENAFWSEDHWDAEDSISKRVGLTPHMYDKPEPPAAIVVVRPDLYIAYSNLVRSTQDIDHAFKFFDGYLKADAV